MIAPTHTAPRTWHLVLMFIATSLRRLVGERDANETAFERNWPFNW
jgi:hypothetical protein